jgi:hypothetical protein
LNRNFVVPVICVIYERYKRFDVIWFKGVEGGARCHRRAVEAMINRNVNHKLKSLPYPVNIFNVVPALAMTSCPLVSKLLVVS